MRLGKRIRSASWLRRNVLGTLATVLIVFSCLGTAQAFFLPATGGVAAWKGGRSVELELESANSLRLSVLLWIRSEPNNQGRGWGRSIGWVRQRRMLHDFELIPRVSGGPDGMWDGRRFFVRADIPYVLTLLLGIGLETLRRGIKNRRTHGFVVSVGNGTREGNDRTN